MDITDIFSDEELKTNVSQIDDPFEDRNGVKETETERRFQQTDLKDVSIHEINNIHKDTKLKEDVFVLNDSIMHDADNENQIKAVENNETDVLENDEADENEHNTINHTTESNEKKHEGIFLSDMTEYCEKIENMNEKLDGLNSKISDIFQCVSEISGYKSAVEKLRHSLTISQNREQKLNEELERYKKGEYYTHIRPFIETMVDFYKEFYNSKKTYIDDKDSIINEYDEKIYQEIIKLHDFMLEMLENRMNSHGLKVKSYEEGSDLNVSEQTVRRKEDTDDAQKEGKIAYILMPAFIHYDKVISKAIVAVYKLVKE